MPEMPDDDFPGVARFADELRDGPQRRQDEAARNAMAKAVPVLQSLAESAERLGKTMSESCRAWQSFNKAMAAMPKPEPWWKRWQMTIPAPFGWP